METRSDLSMVLQNLLQYTETVIDHLRREGKQAGTGLGTVDQPQAKKLV